MAPSVSSPNVLGVVEHLAGDDDEKYREEEGEGEGTLKAMGPVDDGNVGRKRGSGVGLIQVPE